MKALNGIHNGAEDFERARYIFQGGAAGPFPVMTTAAARLADDMAEAFGSFEHIADSANGKGARVLASFGAMAAELRRLQDSEANYKRIAGELEGRCNALQSEAAALEDSLTGHAARNRELVAELGETRAKLDSVAYDIGELPARLVAGDIPAAASLIRDLPAIKESIRQADSVLGDNV